MKFLEICFIKHLEGEDFDTNPQKILKYFYFKINIFFSDFDFALITLGFKGT
jgi:hypothetical protein